MDGNREVCKRLFRRNSTLSEQGERVCSRFHLSEVSQVGNLCGRKRGGGGGVGKGLRYAGGIQLVVEEGLWSREEWSDMGEGRWSVIPAIVSPELRWTTERGEEWKGREEGRKEFLRAGKRDNSASHNKSQAAHARFSAPVALVAQAASSNLYDHRQKALP